MGLALALAGCGPSEIDPGAPARNEAPEKHIISEKPVNTSSRPGPGIPPGPIQPSPVPSLPATTKYDPKQDEAAKTDEAKPEAKKDEPKKEETPK